MRFGARWFGNVSDGKKKGRVKKKKMLGGTASLQTKKKLLELLGKIFCWFCLCSQTLMAGIASSDILWRRVVGIQVSCKCQRSGGR